MRSGGGWKLPPASDIAVGTSLDGFGVTGLLPFLTRARNIPTSCSCSAGCFELPADLMFCCS